MGIRDLDWLALEATGGIIAGLTDDQLDLPTPCTEWTVRDVVEHLVVNATTHASGVSGIAVEPPEGNVRERYAAAASHLTAMLSRDGALDIPVKLGKFGTFDGPIALGVHFVDVLVHGWDIGQAIGTPIEFDGKLAAPALRMAERYPDTPPTRGPGGAFAARRPVPGDAPAGIRLLATLGRQVRWPA
jgi:uncharacterized protein (TIGR03086 family)